MNIEGILGPRGFLNHANLEGNKKTFSITLTDQEYETVEEYQKLSDRSRNNTIRALLAFYFRGYDPSWAAERDFIQTIRDAWRKEHPDQHRLFHENQESKPIPRVTQIKGIRSEGNVYFLPNSPIEELIQKARESMAEGTASDQGGASRMALMEILADLQGLSWGDFQHVHEIVKEMIQRRRKGGGR